jgi:hypothetical protein
MVWTMARKLRLAVVLLLALTLGTSTYVTAWSPRARRCQGRGQRAAPRHGALGHRDGQAEVQRDLSALLHGASLQAPVRRQLLETLEASFARIEAGGAAFQALPHAPATRAAFEDGWSAVRDWSLHAKVERELLRRREALLEQGRDPGAPELAALQREAFSNWLALAQEALTSDARLMKAIDTNAAEVDEAQRRAAAALGRARALLLVGLLVVCLATAAGGLWLSRLISRSVKSTARPASDRRRGRGAPRRLAPRPPGWRWTSARWCTENEVMDASWSPSGHGRTPGPDQPR